MKELNDELINKYLDKDINETELKFIKDILANNPDAALKIRTMQKVDEYLREIEISPAPFGFTEKIMSKLPSATIVKQKTSMYFSFVLTVFFTGIIIVLGFMISNIDFSTSSESKAKPIFDSLKNSIGENIGFFSSIFKNENIMMIGAILTLVLIVSGFFIIENHKNFKNKLNNFGH